MLKSKTFSLITASLMCVATGAQAGVVASGSNGYGQSTVPSGLDSAVAVSGGLDFSVALLSDGSVRAWGYSGEGRTDVPAGLSGVVAISAGAYHTLCLKGDGSISGFGGNPSGVLSIPAVDNAIGVAAGQFHSLALMADGSVIGWGFPGDGRIATPAGLAGVVAIDAGRDHSLALQADGTVVAWGNNDRGQCDVPEGLSGVTAIAAGGFHSLALKADGTVVAWGDNGSNQGAVPAGLSGVTAIAAGEYHSLALGNGNVTAWGSNEEGQLGVASTSGATAISAGGVHSLAVTGSGPAITAHPQSRTVVPGSQVSFSVSATGDSLAYQWLAGGAPINGANSSTLTLEGVGADDAGVYSVVVSGGSGIAYSQGALLSVRSLQRIAAPEIVGGSTVRLRFGDSLGGAVAYSALSRFSVQASYDLDTWFETGLALTWNDGNVELEDAIDAQMPGKFYRVVEK